MKNLILFTLLLISVAASAQKKEKKPSFYGAVDYGEDLQIGQCEVSYSDWFAFLYDSYWGGEIGEFDHLIPSIKKSESRMLWQYFLRNWDEEEDYVRVKIKSAIVRYELWLDGDGSVEMFNLKRHLEIPITGLTRDQINEYLAWYGEIQREYYLSGNDNYDMTLSLPSLQLAEELTNGARRGEYAVGDSVNSKGCQLFNFYSVVPCEGTEGRIKVYGNSNGIVAKNDYFPDNNGLYNILGNAAEMTDEPGVSYGGSYNQTASVILSTSTQKYNEPDTLVGFRVVFNLTKK